MVDFSNHTVLLKEIKKGNVQAFEQTYKRYYYRLKGFAMNFITNADEVDDIIQECFLIVWEKRENLAVISLPSLLFKIVRNSCLNHLKHASVVNKHIEKYYPISEMEERLYYADFGLDASQKLLYDELNEQVDSVMQQLPQRCKEVFVLSRENGLKNREIAQKLEISTTAVEKHIRKALSMFTFHLKEKYPIDYTFFIAVFLHLLTL
ncbi:MAG: RNA polymerase sigma-70 factor [Bacteroidia bacterium]|nr:RNA polymerase sigma-70 factor [Bacteroidia bacterium]